MPDALLLRLGVLPIMFLGACAHPPEAELDLAAVRIEFARAADATIFAAEPLNQAETSLAAARGMSDEERYLEAIHHASEAVMLADEAFGVATIEKKIAMRHVDHCLLELEGLMAIARSHGATAAALAPFEERYVLVKTVAENGDLLAALEQGRQLKPELLAFEQSLR